MTTNTLCQKVNALHLTTERLTVRRPISQDQEAHLIHTLDPEVCRHIREVPSVEDAKRAFIDLLDPWQGDEHEWACFMVELQRDKAVIGSVAFRYTSHEDNIVEIGYRFNRAYQGHGYAIEAMTAFIDALQQQIQVRKLIALVSVENTPSLKLIEKLNMEQEGYFKLNHFVVDHWVDEKQFALLNPYFSYIN
ncbi:GNAT family N-acetyltransferase [Flocculibacter collagenilyticus]|uniref:GNAT family N-acetyltransferase n=1 Tax=Flocculibacter collagenilyticus TaxID=2744479 RepID=UPI0018F3BA24|nr:GNAT family N-acetyltransferase [Flocculibacter collagenilyticus]